MLIKYGDSKVLKIVHEDELNIDTKKVKKAINKSKKNIKNSLTISVNK